MVRRILLCVFASGTLLGLAGCRHCCRSCTTPRPYLPPPPGGAFLNAPTRTIPPTSVPTSPFAPPPGSVVPADGAIPPPDLGVPRDRNFRPTPPPPSSVVPNAGPEVLYPSTPSNGGVPPFIPLGGATPEPPKAAPPAARPEASAELPGYVDLKSGVAAGLRPRLPGFGVLKDKGFRTVAFLHDPGADTSNEKDLVEKQGLAFVAVPADASREKLSDALAAVNALVADTSKHPIYVFANDARGGAVWYLHFRTVESTKDDEAKVRANGLGLSSTDTAYWIGIQQILQR